MLQRPIQTTHLIVMWDLASSGNSVPIASGCTLGRRGNVKTGIPTEMGRQVAVVLFGVAMTAVIVGVDFAFFRNRFWERLTVNIGIVLVFGAFYFRSLRRP